LAIVLIGLLIVLLVLRFRSKQKERQDESRTSYWHLLFWPGLILLILLIKNRLFWCYIIPLWLFLALILIMQSILLLVWLFPTDKLTRRRPWLLIILLFLLVLIWYTFFSNQWIYLLGMLLILLFLIWIIR